jgi:hypothetical protein
MAGVPSAFRSRTIVRTFAVIAVAFALTGPGTGAAVAVDPPDPLAATMFDVALVRWAPTTPNVPPDLLAVEPDDEEPGHAKVVLLHRYNDAWFEAAAERIDVHRSPDAPAPWLIDLGEGRFALLSAYVDGSSTDIIPVTVGPLGPSDLVVGDPVQADFAVTDAGAADVDGDGTDELVVSTSSESACAQTSMAVYNGITFEENHAFSVHQTRLAGAAIGEFDESPGADLLAHAYGTCPIAPDSVQPHSIVVIRLADGAVVHEQIRLDEDRPRVAPGLPLVVDVDGDGRDEAIIRETSDVVVLDPSHDWETVKLGVGDAIPLVAFDSPTRVVWVADSAALRPAGVVAIERGADGRLTAPTDAGFSVIETVRQAVQTTFQTSLERAIAGRPPPVALIDFDRDGCPDIVAPLVIAPCLGLRSLDLGPRWLATVPLAAYDGYGQGTGLVALGLEWQPGTGNPPDPSPVGAGESRVWRHGPSVAFELAEIPSAHMSVLGQPARPAVDANVASDGSVAVGAEPGSRLLVRARPIDSGEMVADLSIARDDFLSGPVISTATVFMTPPIASAGDGTASGGGAARFDVRDLSRADGSKPDRWLVDVAQLDALGDMGGPIRAVVALDVTAPDLAVEPPFVSAVWPLRAKVHGHAEAGAEVRLGEGAPVRADGSGAFEVETQLVPWPQTLEFTATDAFGNPTTERVSVMGGVDVRQLPWAAIITASFLLAAVITSIRGARRGRPAPIGRPVTTDELPMPEIEELPVRAAQRRD